jgi:hypothetical protein
MASPIAGNCLPAMRYIQSALYCAFLLLAGLSLPTIGRSQDTATDSKPRTEVYRGANNKHHYVVSVTHIPFDRRRHHATVTHEKDSDGDVEDVYWIDGVREATRTHRNWYGTDGDFPLSEIQRFEIVVDSKRWPLRPSLWKGCYEDWNSCDIHLSRNGKRLRIEVSASDGVAYYVVVWTVQSNGNASRTFPTDSVD